MLDEEIRKIHDTAPFGSKLLVISVSHFDESFLFERIESKKKFQKNKKRDGRGEKQEESEIKEKWKLHNRIENRVKVIRHNLTFREMTTTPSTNLVRHLYLARHFPRQKVVKINEYQCPSARNRSIVRDTPGTRFRGPQVIPSSGSFR